MIFRKLSLPAFLHSLALVVALARVLDEWVSVLVSHLLASYFAPHLTVLLNGMSASM